VAALLCVVARWLWQTVTQQRWWEVETLKIRRGWGCAAKYENATANGSLVGRAVNVSLSPGRSLARS